MGIIEFKDVSFSYDGVAKALNGLSLQIDEGSFVCVLGGNGSGKSTLARHIDALLVPDSGEVRVLGLDTKDPANLYRIRSSSGLVFQNPDDQIVASVVEDDVAFGPENLGVPSSELPKRVDDALSRVGLSGYEKRETFALSGGQKQRVAIAGALAMEPKILVFDEASTMLDPRGRRALTRLCHKLNDSGMTIVLITHFMDEAAKADRVVVMEDGKVAMDGSPEQVLMEARRLRELSLEVPFAVHMSLALQDDGMPIRTHIEEDALEDQVVSMLGKHATTHDAKRAPMRSSEEHLRETTDGSAPIISLENVYFSYGSKKAKGSSGEEPWALRDVSLSLHEGDFLGIAGHTGSGKSTLTQIMAGLMRPTKGEVLAHGRNLANKENLHDIRRSVGMVFQYPEHQLFAKTVFEDVAFGPRNLGLAADEVEERVDEALELVHLNPADICENSPFELSGGQQRRVALAGVLAMKPSVLILDEPTAGLDPRAHNLFLGLIAELHRTSNSATVMVSHSMDDIAALCNRVALLSNGSLVADGAPRDIFSDEDELRAMGLGVPRTVHLAHMLGMGSCFDSIPTIDELAACIASRWRASLAGDPR